MDHVASDVDSDLPYDSLLVVSFGGPEGRQDVLPFLENVLRGRNISRERLLEVAEHYYEFDGVSPINAQNRQLIGALEVELAAQGPPLPIYWGNRNWHPLLVDTIRKMRDDGVRRSLAFFTSAYSSYSGCRQYCENIAQAREQVGPDAPVIEKLRAFYNHPGFIHPMIDRVRVALEDVPATRRGAVKILYTAHSLPTAMAENCDYVAQLTEACRLVSEALSLKNSELVYQSRSGPPSQPWLEPDVCDAIRLVCGNGAAEDVVLVPIGFVSDHMEVIFDLDTEASELCQQLGIHMVRAGTVGTHPDFVTMIRKLILERTTGAPREVLGKSGPRSDDCPSDCCSSPRMSRSKND
jgi:ferrochelatase